MVSEGYRDIMIANGEPNHTHKPITYPIAAQLLCSIALKYFINRKGQWQFHGWQKIKDMDCQFNLFQIAKAPIERHVKIRSAATPFPPQYHEYLGKRKHKRLARNSWIEPALSTL
ncbi:hypothetical protein A9266_04125 [Vibrio tasmaniensis]|nr:hypothetical protein A9266_04125 [Vibrio tasmaniensis]